MIKIDEFPLKRYHDITGLSATHVTPTGNRASRSVKAPSFGPFRKISGGHPDFMSAISKPEGGTEASLVLKSVYITCTPDLQAYAYNRIDVQI